MNTLTEILDDTMHKISPPDRMFANPLVGYYFPEANLNEQELIQYVDSNVLRTELSSLIWYYEEVL